MRQRIGLGFNPKPQNGPDPALAILIDQYRYLVGSHLFAVSLSNIVHANTTGCIILSQQQQHHIAEIGTSKAKHSSDEMVEITAGVKVMNILLPTHTHKHILL